MDFAAGPARATETMGRRPDVPGSDTAPSPTTPSAPAATTVSLLVVVNFGVDVGCERMPTFLTRSLPLLVSASVRTFLPSTDTMRSPTSTRPRKVHAEWTRVITAPPPASGAMARVRPSRPGETVSMSRVGIAAVDSSTFIRAATSSVLRRFRAACRCSFSSSLCHFFASLFSSRTAAFASFSFLLSSAFSSSVFIRRGRSHVKPSTLSSFAIRSSDILDFSPRRHRS
mmetsp:Transcript_658/g.1509  ORF Transcript_658/g.1509 Transcript_658/m.1509 type:complete len:228 (+) Transcript_658:527-1210(+)